MIDIWMIFCILYPFIEVSLYSARETIRSRRMTRITSAKSSLTSKSEDTINVILNWGLPLVALGFCTIYWIFGLAHYQLDNAETTCGDPLL